MRKAIFALLAGLLLSGIVLARKGDRNVPVPADHVLVAELLSDAYAAESSMLIKIENEIHLDDLVYIVARDGTYQEAAPVMHVYGNYLILKQHLVKTYLSGSKLYQQRAN